MTSGTATLYTTHTLTFIQERPESFRFVSQSTAEGYTPQTSLRDVLFAASGETS